jgi:tyrosinase
VPYTSRDCINVETPLGFTYSEDEAPGRDAVAAAVHAAQGRVAVVSGINRGPIRRSFLISVFGNVAGERVHLGTKAVLSHWNVQHCVNCQAHLEVKAFIDVPGPQLR